MEHEVSEVLLRVDVGLCSMFLSAMDDDRELALGRACFKTGKDLGERSADGFFIHLGQLAGHYSLAVSQDRGHILDGPDDPVWSFIKDHGPLFR